MCPGANLVRASRGDLVSRFQIAKHFDERTRCQARLHIDPLGTATSDANDECASSGARDAAALGVAGVALERHEALECPGYTREDAARLALNAVLYSLHQ